MLITGEPDTFFSVAAERHHMLEDGQRPKSGFADGKQLWIAGEGGGLSGVNGACFFNVLGECDFQDKPGFDFRQIIDGIGTISVNTLNAEGWLAGISDLTGTYFDILEAKESFVNKRALRVWDKGRETTTALNLTVLRNTITSMLGTTGIKDVCTSPVELAFGVANLADLSFKLKTTRTNVTEATLIDDTMSAVHIPYFAGPAPNQEIDGGIASNAVGVVSERVKQANEPEYPDVHILLLRNTSSGYRLSNLALGPFAGNWIGQENQRYGESGVGPFRATLLFEQNQIRHILATRRGRLATREVASVTAIAPEGPDIGLICDDPDALKASRARSEQVIRSVLAHPESAPATYPKDRPTRSVVSQVLEVAYSNYRKLRNQKEGGEVLSHLEPTYSAATKQA